MKLWLISVALCGLPWVALADNLARADPTTPECRLGGGCTSTTSEGVSPTSTGIPMAVVPVTSSTSTLKSDSKGPRSNNPAIIGGVVSGVAVLALLTIFLVFLRRRKRKGDPKSHHEAIAVLDKSRASSPASHASPIYGGAHPPIDGSAPPPPPPPITTYHDRQTTYDEPHQQPQQQLPPPHPVVAPAELQSREVDEDGVSVSSFDMQRPQASSVPRLPVYQRGTPPGSSTTGL